MAMMAEAKADARALLEYDKELKAIRKAEKATAKAEEKLMKQAIKAANDHFKLLQQVEKAARKLEKEKQMLQADKKRMKRERGGEASDGQAKLSFMVLSDGRLQLDGIQHPQENGNVGV